jgi:hypothetical protein
MGVFKKRADKAAAGLPDHPGEIAKRLPAGERVVGWGHVHPLALVTDKNARRNGAIGMAINIASQRLAEHQHLAGADGSAAMSIPRDLNGRVTVAITDQRLTFWSFGATMRDVPPTLLAAFPRGDVRWIAKTGGSNQHGLFVRFSFADESFIDFAITAHERYASFFAAAADIGR